MGVSGPGGLDYLVLNHLGATPAGTRSRSVQATRWLLQVPRPAAPSASPLLSPGCTLRPSQFPPQVRPLLGPSHRRQSPPLPGSSLSAKR